MVSICSFVIPGLFLHTPVFVVFIVGCYCEQLRALDLSSGVSDQQSVDSMPSFGT